LARPVIDGFEKQHLVGLPTLEANHSLSLVGRRIVIRREQGAKVGRRLSFSTRSIETSRAQDGWGTTDAGSILK